MIGRRARALAAAMLSAACTASQAPTQSPSGEWLTLFNEHTTVEYQRADTAAATQALAYTTAARAQLESYFGATFPAKITVHLYSSRASFDDMWRSIGVSPQCWMIARGGREFVGELSPRLWQTDSCGHDGGNTTHVQQIMTHEMVHVLHAHLNASPDINGVQDVKWFNEGVAWLAAGQFDASERARIVTMLRSGFAPARIAELWVLPTPDYSLGASLTAYIDATYGRPATRALLAARTTTEILAMLGVSETELLNQWRAAALR